MPATKPTSYRLSNDVRQYLARIAFDHQLASEADAIRYLTKWHQCQRVPSPLRPALPPIKDLNKIVQTLADFAEVIRQTARHAQVRHLDGETSERAALIDKWQKQIHETVVDLEKFTAELRIRRLGVLTAREMDLEKLRGADLLIQSVANNLSRSIKAQKVAADDLEDVATQLDVINELRIFLCGCGIFSGEEVLPANN